ncbi:hypothetical protein PO124_04785 [Bacillus licheniformis]|nr:hypothetical protein [Bacillus licheniformis]
MERSTNKDESKDGRQIGDDQTTPAKDITAVTKFELILMNWEGSHVERSRSVSSRSLYFGSSKHASPECGQKRRSTNC